MQMHLVPVHQLSCNTDSTFNPVHNVTVYSAVSDQICIIIDLKYLSLKLYLNFLNVSQSEPKKKNQNAATHYNLVGMQIYIYF